MDNNSTHAQTGGMILGVFAYMLHIDWVHVCYTLLNTEMWQAVFDFSIQMLKVGVAGIIGGAGGKFGGKLIEKYLPSKKKRTTKSHNN